MRGLVIAALIALLLLARRGQAFSYARVIRSQTAAKYGVSNEAPPHLRPRLRGLAIVAGAIGEPINSLYRSPIVNALVDFENENPGSTADPALITPSSSTRPHVQGRSLDLDGPSIDACRERLRRSGFESIVTSTLDEGNHLHVQFDAAALEALDDGVRD